MKSRGITFLFLSATILGALFWGLHAARSVEGQATDTICVGGQCYVQLPATQQAARSGVKWPPRLGEPYPDLELIDQTGQIVRLSSFKGSVVLVEPVGMTCPACQAFAGAHRYGSFEGVAPQRGLLSIEELFPKYTNGLSLSDDRIVLVQLLLYSMSMRAPSPGDARRWAEHFRMDRSKNFIVLAGTKELLGQASYNMIPGFQLVDRNFILRADSTGHRPRHNLWKYLLPMVPQLLQ